MICPDCGQEVNKLTTQGRCNQCRTRFNQNNYLNKRDGINKPYVPLIELKETNPKLYNRLMAKRTPVKTNEKTKTTKKANPVIKTTEIYEEKAKISTVEDIRKQAEIDVAVDIEHYRKLKDIKKLDFSINDLIKAFDMINLAVSSDLEKLIGLNRQIYDMLMIDYFHELKCGDTSQYGAEYYIKHGLKEEELQNQRTPIKNLGEVYKIMSNAINMIKSNITIVKEIQAAKTEIDLYLSKTQDSFYLSSTPSLQELDFVVESDAKINNRKLSEPNRMNKYSAMIRKCKGLYGDTQYRPFHYKPAIYANNEEEAKEQFINILSRDFSSLTYNSKDIMISFTSESEKECS